MFPWVYEFRWSLGHLMFLGIFFTVLGTVLGKKIEVIAGDHQQKADVSSALARKWIDEEKVDVITSVANSAVALAVQAVVKEKARVLINTAAVADNIRDIEKALNIPDLIAEGTVSYGMQSFDQSLMKWYKEGMVAYESALFYSSNPSEFALHLEALAPVGIQGFVDPGFGHRRPLGMVDKRTRRPDLPDGASFSMRGPRAAASNRCSC